MVICGAMVPVLGSGMRIAIIIVLVIAWHSYTREALPYINRGHQTLLSLFQLVLLSIVVFAQIIKGETLSPRNEGIMSVLVTAIMVWIALRVYNAYLTEAAHELVDALCDRAPVDARRFDAVFVGMNVELLTQAVLAAALSCLDATDATAWAYLHEQLLPLAVVWDRPMSMWLIFALNRDEALDRAERLALTANVASVDRAGFDRQLAKLTGPIAGDMLPFARFGFDAFCRDDDDDESSSGRDDDASTSRSVDVHALPSAFAHVFDAFQTSTGRDYADQQEFLGVLGGAYGKKVEVRDDREDRYSPEDVEQGTSYNNNNALTRSFRTRRRNWLFPKTRRRGLEMVVKETSLRLKKLHSPRLSPSSRGDDDLGDPSVSRQTFLDLALRAHHRNFNCWLVMEAAARAILQDAQWGQQVLDLAEFEDRTTQNMLQDPLLEAYVNKLGGGKQLKAAIDEKALPEVLRSISANAHPAFVAALRKLFPASPADDGHGSKTQPADDGYDSHDWTSKCTLFKTAHQTAVKKTDRMGTKVVEYRDESKGEWPFTACIIDSLRAMIVADDAEAVVKAYHRLRGDDATHPGHTFKITRLKNKLANADKPFNLHCNCVFSQPNMAPITVEIQIIPRGVLEVFDQSHRLYTISRAPDAASLARQSHT